MILLPLIDILEQYSIQEVENKLSTFFCAKNRDIEDFLHTKAVAYEKAANAKTYLIIHDTDEIAAFFSIALGIVDIKDLQSTTQCKKIRGYGRTKAEYIPCYLLGQVGRNDCFSKNDISLTHILEFIMKIITEVMIKVGGRILYLECDKSLVPLYNKHSFKEIGQRDEYIIMGFSLL